jgi:hypothetical protein
MKYATLRRGTADTSDLVRALDELGVGRGDDFALVPLDELTGDVGKRGPDNGRTTSREAAKANAPRRGTQRAKVLEVIARGARCSVGVPPRGATRDEIAAELFLPPNVIGPRVLELRRQGFVYESGSTRTTRAGEQAAVVFPSDRGLDVARELRRVSA